MELREDLLLGLALCAAAQAFAQTRMELAVAPAWGGWARPGRATEVDVRLSSDAATRATLDVEAGRQTLRTEVQLEPGRPLRLHLPVFSAQQVAVSVRSASGPPERRDVGIARSESPLLGLALETDHTVELEGFHAIKLDADALPRDVLAYASMDALILDMSTLGALDEPQLSALLTHLAQCGRVVALNADARVRRALDAAAGCAGHALLHASTLTEARDMLAASLASSLPEPISMVDASQLNRSVHFSWQRVLVLLALYFAAAALALGFFTSLPALLSIPVLSAVSIFIVLHVLDPQPQLFIWSEGESGAKLARYHAWEWFPGFARGRERTPVPPELASARPCNPGQPMLLDYDPSRGRVVYAEFDTRLFGRSSICFSGGFPVARSIGVWGRPDGALEVQNTGTRSWPTGALLAGGRVQDLPALEPGGKMIMDGSAARVREDSLVRTAMARIAPMGQAALWTLDLGSIAKLPPGSQGWLLVSIPVP